MNQSENKSNRDLNFELLRLFSIISIVVGHMGAVGRGVQNPLCYLGDVNCFVLISGYFLIDAKFKSVRFLRLAIETIFYCFIISLVFAIVGKDVSNVALLKSIFPFAPTQFSYWYVNRFLALLLLQPFIGILLRHLTQTQYKYLLIVLYLINSELIIVFPFAELFNNGFSLPWLLTVFLTGGYIRKYNPFSNFKNWGMLWILSSGCFYLASTYGPSLFNLGYNNWIFMAKSLTMFMFVKNIRISQTSVLGKAIAFASPHVLSIYLIQEQSVLKKWLIETGLNIVSEGGQIQILLLWSAYGFAIIVGCILIDKVRVWIFDKAGINSYISKTGKSFDDEFKHVAKVDMV